MNLDGLGPGEGGQRFSAQQAPPASYNVLPLIC